MKISFHELKKNTQDFLKIGDLKYFKEKIQDLQKYDKNNKLNDLTLAEWIIHTKSFHFFKEKVQKDINKSCHPATFEEELPFYFIEFFSKMNDIVFDPFMGTGTTSISANILNRKSIGIEINEFFLNILNHRFKINKLNPKKHVIFKGDCFFLLKEGSIGSYLKQRNEKIDLTITSPPYFNIIKKFTNKKNTSLKNSIKYHNSEFNLLNIDDYDIFLNLLTEIFEEIYKITKNKGYLLINVQNFYRKTQYKNGNYGQEYVFFAWDLTKKISKTRWIPCGEQIWLYPNKKLFPFGNPFIYLSNVVHSYILIFFKDERKK